MVQSLGGNDPPGKPDPRPADRERRSGWQEPARGESDSFHAVLDALPDGFAILSGVEDRSGHTIDFRCDYVNPAGRRLAGWPAASASPPYLSEMRSASARDALLGGCREVLDSLSSKEWEALEFDDLGTGRRLARALSCHAWRLADGVGLTFKDITERKREELRLRESNDILAGIIEGIPDFVVAQDTSFRFLAFNRAFGDEFRRIFGTEAAVGTSMVEALAHLPEEQAKAVALWRRILGGEPYILTREIGDERLERRIYEGRSSPLRDAQGRLIGASLVVRDVTIRERARTELARREEELNEAQRLTHIGSWEWHPESDRVTWSEELYRIHDLDPAQPPPSYHEYGRCYTAESFARLNTAVARALESGTPFELDLEYVRSGGTRGWLTSRGEAVRDSAGRIDRLRGTVQEISERKRAEQALREANETLERKVAERTAALAESERQLIRRQALLNAVCDEAKEGIYVKDRESRLLLANPSVLRVVGKPAEEILGHSDAEFFDDPEIGAAIVATDRRIMESGHPETVEEVVMTPQGRRIFLSTKSPWRDSDGNVIGIIGVSRDITERKHAVEALVQGDRRKDEFLATLAHELRNPLAPIQNGLYILQAQDVARTLDAQVLGIMQRQVDHLVRLVDDLLDVSRIITGKIELKKELLDLRSVLKQALETSRPLIDAGRHDLRVSLPAEPVFVEGDPTRLAQLLANLLNNAAKYTPDGGRIELVLEEPGSQAVVRVRDSGRGIPAEMLSRVFEMFTQVNRPLGQSQGGLGIGLSLVKRLTEKHGGTVEARSEGTDRGSEFILTFPLATPSLERRDGRPLRGLERTAAGTSRRVLVVDDNRDVAQTLSSLLRVMGHEVLSTHDGASALEIAESFRPEVVLLDLGMPVMDGYEVARRIRRSPALRDVLLVAQTGWGQDEDRLRSREAGFDHHLVKPVDQVQLQELIRKGRPR